MASQQLSRASPSEGFSTARQAMAQTADYYLTHGGPAIAREQVNQLAGILRFCDDCKEAYCEAIAKIDIAEDAEKQRAYELEQQRLINQLMGVIKTDQKSGKPTDAERANDDSSPTALPAKLTTPKAMQLWQRLQEAGYIDENYQPVDLSRTEMAILAFEMSKRLGISNKWKTFVLDLSFIGWDILSVMTWGILEIFFVAPYKASTDAALYESLKYGIDVK